MARKKYLNKKDMPIFVADKEISRKYVLPEFAQDDERFLRRLSSAHEVYYAMDRLSQEYDLVEVPRSRRNPAQNIPAAILAQLLGFAQMDLDRLPPIPTQEEAEAILAEIKEPEIPFFRRKTPEQVIEEVREVRRKMAKEVSADSLEELRRWLAEYYEYVSTIRN